MSNEHYVVDLIGKSGPLCDLEMTSRDLLHDGDLELYCSCVFHFNVDDSLMYDYAQRFNERYDNALSDRGYIGFTIETDLTIYIPPEALEQLDTDRMSVILGGECRLQTCDDKSGREHDVSETAFADKFNEHFVHMLDTFDDVCNFKVKSIKKL